MKAKIRNFLLTFYETGLTDSIYQIGGWVLSLLISVYFLILMSLPLFETSFPKGIVFATDNDGGRAIEVSLQTNWYSSNHFAPYGNLYYRLSHTVADIIPLYSDILDKEESRERAHHFSLKLISLFSLMGLGLFFGWIYFGLSPLTLLFGTALTSAALKLPMWVEWIVRPHPEHLLNLTIAIALYFYAKHLNNRDDLRTLIISAMSWGIAMAVKRSTSMFIPGILIFGLLPLTQKNFAATTRYISYMLLAYLAIGFPQNFGFYKHIKFLLYESSLHSVADVQSLSQTVRLTWDQLFYIIPLLLGFVLFSTNKEKSFSGKFVLFILISALPILMRKLSYTGDHHTMPIAISIFVAIVVAMLHYIPWRIPYKWAAFFILIIIIKNTGNSEVFQEWNQKSIKCLSEIEFINKTLDAQLSKDTTLVKEPYFPESSKTRPYSQTIWGLDWNQITSKTLFFGVRTFNIREHLADPPKGFYGKLSERWDDKRKFYNQINNSTEVSAPDGRLFKKIFSGVNCDFELWEANKR